MWIYQILDLFGIAEILWVRAWYVFIKKCQRYPSTSSTVAHHQIHASAGNLSVRVTDHEFEFFTSSSKTDLMWANWNKSSTCFPAGRKNVRLFSTPGKLGMNPGFWRSRSAIFWRRCLNEHEHQGCITKPHVCHRCSVVWILNIKWNKSKGRSSTWIWETSMSPMHCPPCGTFVIWKMQGHMCKGVSMAGGAPFVCLRAGWRCACPYPTTPPGPQGRHHYKQTGVTDITLTASHLIVERRTTTPWRPALQIYTMHYMPQHAPICPSMPL